MGDTTQDMTQNLPSNKEIKKPEASKDKEGKYHTSSVYRTSNLTMRSHPLSRLSIE